MSDEIFRQPVKPTDTWEDVTHAIVHAPFHSPHRKAAFCSIYLAKIDGKFRTLTNLMTSPAVRLEAMDRKSGKRLAQLRTDVCNQLRAKSGAVWDQLKAYAAERKVELVGEPEFC